MLWALFSGIKQAFLIFTGAKLRAIATQIAIKSTCKVIALIKGVITTLKAIKKFAIKPKMLVFSK